MNLSKIKVSLNYVTVLAITSKEFGKGDGDGKQSMTTTNRQIDWYNAERRFIFACLTAKEKNRWMEEINSNIFKTKIAEGIQHQMEYTKTRKYYSPVARKKPKQLNKVATRSLSFPQSPVLQMSMMLNGKVTDEEKDGIDYYNLAVKIHEELKIGTKSEMA